MTPVWGARRTARPRSAGMACVVPSGGRGRRAGVVRGVGLGLCGVGAVFGGGRRLGWLPVARQVLVRGRLWGAVRPGRPARCQYRSRGVVAGALSPLK